MIIPNDLIRLKCYGVAIRIKARDISRIPTMATIKEIINFVEEIAPPEMQEEWDNTGMQICSDVNKDVKKACVALDCDHSIIGKLDCELLITHHPLILFKGPMTIQGAIFRLVEHFIKNDVAVYSSHTALDRTLMNKAIADDIFQDIRFSYLDAETMGIIVEFEEEIEFEELLAKMKIVPEKFLRKEKVKRVGVIGGSGFSGEHAEEFRKLGADVIVSGDLTHHNAQKLDEMGMGAIDIGHAAEIIGMVQLAEKLQQQFPEVEFKLIEPRKYWELR